ncbi:hypothetical protein KEM48_007809 [Puccinia striiformis f. sp. tritici PST-130]|nr:hypothetical protein KEM48_007809 [Puccinia striiformis f. sp. tritici PST-130]
MHSAEHTRTIGTPSSTSRSNTPSTFHQLSSYQQLKRTTSKLFRSLTPTPPAVSPTAQHHSQPIHLLYNEPPPSANPSRWRLLNRLRNRNHASPIIPTTTTTNTEPLPSKLLKTKISPFRSLESKNLSHHNRICSTSKSLNNINLNWIESQQQEQHQTQVVLPQNLSRSSTLNSTTFITNNNGDDSPPRTTQQRRASRQTIYVPMDVDTIDIQRHHHQLKLKRPHSPTEIALSHLDDILRGTRSLDTPKESSTLNYPTLLNQRPPPSTSKPNSNNNSNPSSSSSSANTPIYLNALSPPNRPSRKLNSNSTTTNHRRTQSSSTEFGSRTLTSNSHHPQLQLQTNTNVNNHKVLIHPTTWQTISISAAMKQKSNERLLDDDQSERMDIDPTPPSVLPTSSITTTDRVANPSLNCSISSGFKSKHDHDHRSRPASGLVSDDEHDRISDSSSSESTHLTHSIDTRNLNNLTIESAHVPPTLDLNDYNRSNLSICSPDYLHHKFHSSIHTIHANSNSNSNSHSRSHSHAYGNQF